MKKKRFRKCYVALWLSKEEKKFLTDIAKRKGLTLSQVIREKCLLDFYIDKNKPTTVPLITKP